MNVRRTAWRLVGPLVLAGLVACQRHEPASILVTYDRVTVVNLTDKAWTGVDVWLNHYYRAQAPRLEPRQRVDVPIGVFIAGYGQRFDRKKQHPTGIEVMATSADGKRVRLTWGTVVPQR